MAYLILVGEHCRNGFCWGFEVVFQIIYYYIRNFRVQKKFFLMQKNSFFGFFLHKSHENLVTRPQLISFWLNLKIIYVLMLIHSAITEIDMRLQSKVYWLVSERRKNGLENWILTQWYIIQITVKVLRNNKIYIFLKCWNPYVNSMILKPGFSESETLVLPNPKHWLYWIHLTWFKTLVLPNPLH